MKVAKIFILFILTTSILYSQNRVDSTNSNTQVNLKSSPNSTQAVNDKIEFKNESNSSIITITDEGGNKGSITFPSMSSAPSSTTNKLYNIGGVLKFNGSDIGNAGGSGGGWTDSGTKIYTTTITDNVGIGTTNPLSPLSVGAPGSTDIGIMAAAPTSSGTGIFGISTGGTGISSYTAVGTGIRGEVTLGNAIVGFVTNDVSSNGVAGLFEVQTGPGTAVHGTASGVGIYKNYGGFFEANADSGIAVYGIATSTNARNHGGYFEANGSGSRGVYGFSAGENGRGVLGEASGSVSGGVLGRSTGASGRGIQGAATDDDINSVNYGGYFQAAGGKGYGVYAHATNAASGDNLNKTYGGHFTADSPQGVGVYGHSTSEEYLWNDPNERYGGYFVADDGTGVYGETKGTAAIRAGVYGVSTNTSAIITYGGHFISNGTYGIGAQGEAHGPNANGVRGEADGENGIGVEGRSDGMNGVGVAGYGNGIGSNGIGVVGYGQAYDFDAQGSGVNYGATSSIRWKRNIIEIDDPLVKLSKLRGVYFDWDEEHGGAKDIGCIAEEVGKVLPEIVVYEENGVDADGMDYSKLTPLLIEVAKAQQEIIQQLTERITRLEND